MSTVLKILVIISSILLALAGDKCRILVLEGGGQKGAYQSGAFQAMIDTLPANEIQYDVYSGVSIGSYNALGFGFFGKGNEKEASEFVKSFWFKPNPLNETIEIQSKLQTFKNIFFSNSILNTAPLTQSMENFVGNKTLNSYVAMGATNYNTGLYDNFKLNSSNTPSDLGKAALASSAIEVFFTPRVYKNYTYGDGGLVRNFDVASGIQYCQELGFSDSSIIADVILLDPISQPEFTNVSDYNSIDSLKRTFQIHHFNTEARNLYEISLIYPEVFVRYVFAPKAKLENKTLPIGFSPELIQEIYFKGYNETIEVLSNYPNGNFNETSGRVEEELVNELFLE